MKKNIKDIFDNYCDDSVEIKSNTSISASRIAELTKMKIMEDRKMKTTVKTKRLSAPFIAAAVLAIMGTGAVYGFAITLLIGTLVSLFTALVVTRVLLTSVANMGVGAWIMGAKRNRNAD